MPKAMNKKNSFSSPRQYYPASFDVTAHEMKLQNDLISIEVSAHGAELTSLKKGNTEYLWQADPTFWGRHAPILFPIVGQVWNQTYHVDGAEYHMKQHGFARDLDFESIEEENAIIMRLASNSDTLKAYPYDFTLTARYTLHANAVRCSWTVRNTGNKTMHYQIGAHPAFLYRDFSPSDKLHGMLTVENLTRSAVKPIVRGIIEGGFRAERPRPMKICNIMPLEGKTFDHDALLLEDGQTQIVTLRDKRAKEYLRLTCDCQVFGIWSPTGKEAPFVCIEPWMGRCDRVGFEGDISERDFMQRLEAGEEKEFAYTIEVLD